MANTTFVSWIGERDFNAAEPKADPTAPSPIRNALNHLAPSEKTPTRVILLHDPGDSTKGRRAPEGFEVL